MRRLDVNSIQILNTRVDQVTLTITLDEIQRAITSRNQLIVLGANTRSLNLCVELDWFEEFYRQADIVFCDGVGVQIGAKLLGTNLPERFTPPDWFPDLCKLCVNNDFNLFLVGTHSDVISTVAKSYSEMYPNLRIVGAHHGFFNKDRDSKENQKVINLINDVSPDILLIGFGMPIQEKWLSENLSSLNSTVFITVGAMFDFLAGRTYRGPRWLTDRGFEWLIRLFTEPKRLWQRYLIGNPKFLYRVLMQRLGKM